MKFTVTTLSVFLPLLSASIFIVATCFVPTEYNKWRATFAIVALLVAACASVSQYLREQQHNADDKELRDQVIAAKTEVTNLLTGGESFYYLDFQAAFGKPAPYFTVIGSNAVPSSKIGIHNHTRLVAALQSELTPEELQKDATYTFRTQDAVYPSDTYCLNVDLKLAEGYNHFLFHLLQGQARFVQAVSIVKQDGHLFFSWKLFRVLRREGNNFIVTQEPYHDGFRVHYTDNDFRADVYDFLNRPDLWACVKLDKPPAVERA